ncbi:extracellular solute-binding protein [Paenibacillus sacheonensis]|uniref:Extracellular solute-binding protein n=1 Tax=Paenibacillus sacheonensis TaxID=742054 RepID=A0A7X5BYZ9_9BACL|nr:extracellular solute-binding protein [Paenibacillus sacheonensis]MBM7563946.1 ABC-type glycerol-3-phosphate transport system substrate-binding protein [Paenibacillus sacheonensis]NBC67710.1 extracellular solute-binding protein [Paenibacillus sacheonensis]
MKKHGGIKKSASVLVAATIVAGLLSACGSEKEDNAGGTNNAASQTNNASEGTNASANDTTNAPANTGDAAADAVVEITVWDQPSPDDPAKSFVEEQFAKFDAAHPNIKVKHVEAWQPDVREKFLTAVAGGEGPDLSYSAFPDMQVYIPKGIAADITDLVNGSPDKDRFIDGAFNLATKDGKIYGIPNDMYTSGLIYNKKLFANAGITAPPKTWEEFAADAQLVQQKNAGIVGFDILGMDWADWHFEYYVWQAGGDLTEQQPDGTAKLTFTSDAAVKALQYYKDLKWKYNVTQKNVVQDIGENEKDFYSGRSAMIIGTSDSFTNFVGRGMNPDDIGFAPFPAGPSGKAPAQVGGSFWMLNPKSSPEQQKAAFDYAMFSMSKESQDALGQFKVDNGLGLRPFTVLKDFDVTKFIKDVPQDYLDAVNESAKDQHLEYFLKSSLSSYLVKPIQKVLLDKNADPAAELQKAQDLAQKEVIDKYNNDLKAAK